MTREFVLDGDVAINNRIDIETKNINSSLIDGDAAVKAYATELYDTLSQSILTKEGEIKNIIGEKYLDSIKHTNDTSNAIVTYINNTSDAIVDYINTQDEKIITFINNTSNAVYSNSTIYTDKKIADISNIINDISNYSDENDNKLLVLLNNVSDGICTNLSTEISRISEESKNRDTSIYNWFVLNSSELNNKIDTGFSGLNDICPYG